MRENKIKIIYCGNDAMFFPLYISILTLLRRTRSSIDFYFLSGNLSDLNPKYLSLTKQHEKELIDLVKKYNNKNSFKVIDCAQLYRDNFLSSNKIDIQHWTPYGVFRLFLEQLNIKGKVLYLDTDVLISGDIKEAFNVNIENHEMCVCHDLPHARKNHKTWFNCGVMLINIEKIKTTKLFTKAIKYCIDFLPKYWDQDALNICHSDVIFWPDEYRFNFQPNCPGYKCHTKGKPIITHFYGKLKFHPKPWDIEKFLKRMHRKHIHEWDVDYEIIKSIISKKKWPI